MDSGVFRQGVSVHLHWRWRSGEARRGRRVRRYENQKEEAALDDLLDHRSPAAVLTKPDQYAKYITCRKNMPEWHVKWGPEV